jgi:hypothetical protein
MHTAASNIMTSSKQTLSKPMSKQTWRETLLGMLYQKKHGQADGRARGAVILKKAFYGRPDSGIFWEKHCDRSLRVGGFEPIANWPSCYFRKRLELFLAVHVGDFKLAGPEVNFKAGWDLISKQINIEKPSAAELYLGCFRKKKWLNLKMAKKSLWGATMLKATS